jgi:prophage DNA circulation protein
MFNWFRKKVKKEEFEQHKSAVQTALNSVKQDMHNLSTWIKHLDKQDSDIKSDVQDVSYELSTIKNELEEIKNLVSGEKNKETEPLFKQRQTAKHKQTAVYAVQTAVQTAVQAAFFHKLSVSEKALVMILINHDMKLSYEDLAVMLGKDTATIRGQINSIRQKVEGLIEEQIEKNNKKRLFIPDKMKNILLKRVKVKAEKAKISEKTAENS